MLVTCIKIWEHPKLLELVFIPTVYFIYNKDILTLIYDPCNWQLGRGGSFLTKLDTNHSTTKRFMFMKMKIFFSMDDHVEILKITGKFYNLLFKYHFGQKSWNLFEALRTGHLDLNFKIIGRLEPHLELNVYKVINRGKSLNSLLKNHLARSTEICVEASSGNINSCLFKLWSSGVRRGHNR